MSPRIATRELSGDLGLLPLFDLCQTLGLNRATGTLRLDAEKGKSYIYFEEGQIINGLDERHREGEKAIRAIFGCLEARFQFQAGPVSSARAIEIPTQTLLLDIAREQDEASQGQAGAAGDSQVDKLKAHEALRSAFAKIARDSQSGGDPALKTESAQLLEHLASAPGSELLLRPGQTVLARQGAGWSPLGRQSLGPAEFDDLLRMLSPPGHVLGSGQSALPRSPSGAPFRVMFGEDVSGPFLFLRSLHTQAPSPDLVVLPEGLDWDALLAGPRIEILGGRGTGKSLFLAAAARAACERGLTVAWGSPEPAARLANLDLPLQYLPGGLLTSELFLELAIGLRANLLIWDGPPAVLPGLLRLPEWGTSVLAAGAGLSPPTLSLYTALGPDGRVRLIPPAHSS
jgi:hypothetical protein